MSLYIIIFSRLHKKAGTTIYKNFSTTPWSTPIPDLAVTFVDNHDSQKNSSLESQVKDWFKPLAYGLILLRKDGYPCIFYGDYYSIKRKQSPHRPILDILLDARKKYAHGEQLDYFDHPNTIGFTRKGDEAHPAFRPGPSDLER